MHTGKKKGVRGFKGFREQFFVGGTAGTGGDVTGQVG